MVNPPKQAIALLCFDPDLDAVTAQGNSQCIHQMLPNLVSALTKTGWQVDCFIGSISQSHTYPPTIVRHSPDRRTIDLNATDVSQFVQAFQKFAIQEGCNYPLIHTWNGLAGEVGLQLKQSSGMQWVHSHWQNCHPDLDPQVFPPSYLQTAGEIWRCADEIIAFGRLKSQLKIKSKAEAKRKLGFSSLDRVILCLGSFDWKSDRRVSEVERWLQMVTQFYQMPFIHHERHFSTQRLHWVAIDRNQIHSASCSDIHPNIQKQIAALNLQHVVHCVESCSPKEFLLYHCAADACVLPHLYEPFADNALRAIAYGTPVVASKCSGARFAVVPEETGLLVVSDTPTAWAETIAQVLAGNRWVKRLWQHSLGAYDPVLSWTIAAARLSEVYRRLLAQTMSQMPLWQSQKPYTIALPEQVMVATFSQQDRQPDSIAQPSPPLATPLPLSERVSVATAMRLPTTRHRRMVS